MIPAYLNDLHIDDVFRPYCTNVDAFILWSNKSEHIVDSTAQLISGFVTPTFGAEEDADGKYFELLNPAPVDFALLQVDHGLITDGVVGVKKCDCVVSSANDFALIEFKANAVSDNNNTIKKNYRKALTQLCLTYGYFQTCLATYGLSLTSIRDVEAFVCFKRGYPRLSASEILYRTKFAIATGGIPLSFDSYMTIK